MSRIRTEIELFSFATGDRHVAHHEAMDKSMQRAVRKIKNAVSIDGTRMMVRRIDQVRLSEAQRCNLQLVQHRAVIAATAALLLGFAVARAAHAQAPEISSCTANRCEIVLSHVVTVSDENEELHGAFGSALTFAERDSRGRFFLAVRHGIAVFEGAGQLITRIGGSCSGPGEFTVPTPPPLVGRGDSVHVFDVVQKRVTIFEPDLTVARIVAGIPAPAALILDDGSYVVARQVRTRDRIGFPLHRMPADGQLLRSFGTDTASIVRTFLT